MLEEHGYFTSIPRKYVPNECALLLLPHMCVELKVAHRHIDYSLLYCSVICMLWKSVHYFPQFTLVGS